MKFKPSLDRVLVKRAAAKTQTESGLFLPEPAQEAPLEGTVVAVGPGARYWDANNAQVVSHPVDYKVGDKVFISRYGSNEIEVEGQKYDLLKESEILGKFE